MNTQAITYDPAGNITALTETGTGTTGSKTAYYDSFDRLTSFFNATNTTSYSYDADSNRTSTTVLSTTTTYHYPGSSNRLTSLGGTTTYSYDASGNTTGDGTNTWTYDSRGRMASLIAGTTTATYGINGFGQRITKSGSLVPSGGTNEFVYDEQGHLIGEYGSTGASIEETVYLPDTPVSVLSKGPGLAGFGANAPPVAVLNGSGTVSSVTPDWLGVAHIITNASKVYQWIWDHYAFWDNAPNQNPSGLGGYNYSLRGPRYKDIETNTNYNGQLDMYNPATGIRGQFDPLHSLNPGRSGYIYVNQNPLTNIDPLGLQTEEENDPREDEMEPPGVRGGLDYREDPARQAQEEAKERQELEKRACQVGGNRSNSMNNLSGNKPGNVNGLYYTGHAFDQMQGRGIPPTVVQQTLQYGLPSLGRDGTTIYTDPNTGVTVIVNSNGQVITVY